MLKLERISRKGEIIISLRSKQRLWSKVFFNSLCLAFLLHLLPFFVFQIRFQSPSEMILLPPSRVEIDSATQLDSATPYAKIDQNGFLKPLVEKPALTLPTPLSIPYRSSIPTLSHEREGSIIDVSFEQLEKKPGLIPFKSSVQSPSSKLLIRPLGNFSRHCVKKSSIEKAAEILKTSPISFSTIQVYQVQIEESNGRIFKINKLQGASQPEADHLARRILSTLRFEKKRESGFAEGMVEIHFNIDNEDPSSVVSYEADVEGFFND